MRYLHTMLRVRNLDTALKFYRDALGLKEVRRIDNDKGKFTLVFLCAPQEDELLKNLPMASAAPWALSRSFCSASHCGADMTNSQNLP